MHGERAGASALTLKGERVLSENSIQTALTWTSCVLPLHLIIAAQEQANEALDRRLCGS